MLISFSIQSIVCNKTGLGTRWPKAMRLCMYFLLYFAYATPDLYSSSHLALFVSLSTRFSVDVWMTWVDTVKIRQNQCAVSHQLCSVVVTATTSVTFVTLPVEELHHQKRYHCLTSVTFPLSSSHSPTLSPPMEQCSWVKCGVSVCWSTTLGEPLWGTSIGCVCVS